MKKITNNLAIIRDGNGRWAKEKGKNRSAGHKAGAENLESLALYAKKIGVKVLSVYAFSTDNFKRDEKEVNYLMDLLVYYLNNRLTKFIKKGIRVIVSGRKDNLREDVIEAINDITEKSKNNDECILNICINYGAQEEIVDATIKIHNDINNGKLKIEELNRDSFYKYLYQDLPPIDLLIRTGKEYRLSNFMLYQLFYAELYFSDVYFPDFNEKELDNAITYFNEKDRRFGAIKNVENK